jgi:hypothetical protein
LDSYGRFTGQISLLVSIIPQQSLLSNPKNDRRIFIMLNARELFDNNIEEIFKKVRRFLAY